MPLLRRLIHILTFDILLCLVHGQAVLCPYEECSCANPWAMECVDVPLTTMRLRKGANVLPVKLVDLIDNQIQEISQNSLPSGLSTLTILMNPIRHIDPAAFNGSASTLEILQLSDTVLTELPDALLVLNNLTSFYLGNMSLANWDLTILSHLGHTLQELNLYQLDLRPWPEGFKGLTMLKSLDLENVRIADIPEDAFTNMNDSLKFLRLENSGLKQIPKALLQLSIVELYLTNNSIAHLENIPEVIYLDLNNNFLSDADNVIQALRASANSLEDLYLSYNQLTSIPDLSSFTALTFVAIENNKIAADSNSIRADSSSILDTLSLSYNELTFIPNISGFQFLRNLTLDNNRIISGLTSDSQVLAKNLETLILSNNRLTSLSNFPRSPVLKYLALDNNEISDSVFESYLSDSLQVSAKSLVTLILSYNQFTAIPDLFIFSQLCCLELQFNNISDSTSGFLPLNLYSLQLHGNRLDFIPSVITGLVNLSMLNLSSNSITLFFSSDIPGQLQSLDLSSNLISKLDENSFPENCSLQYLYLQDNPITNITDSAFDKVKGLVRLDLSRTSLSILPLALSSISHLQYLYMYNIPTLICPCPIPKILIQWFRGLPPLYQMEGECGNKEDDISYALFEEIFSGFKCQTTTPTALVETTTEKNNMGVILMIDPRSVVLYLLLYISLVHRI